MARNAPSKRANIITARIIPLVLLGIFGYASWVVTRLVCLNYLLHPADSDDVPRRAGTAVAIVVIYYVLILPVLITYVRLIQTIVMNPGYVPRGAQWRRPEVENPNTKQRDHKRKRNQKTVEEKAGTSPAWPGHGYLSASSGQSTVTFTDGAQPRVEDFWLKDVFVCNYDGRPSFCSTCLNYKPDRTHHCSEVDCCVRKMDHFCPWVGGIISETSFKFFIQFCFYAALFCAYTLVVMAYYFSERRRKTDFFNVNWVLILAFAGLFLFFSAGMFASTFQLAVINSTTVENLSRKTKVWYLAVYMPRPADVFRRIETNGGKAPRTISYPRPLEEQQVLVEQSGRTASNPPAPLNPQSADPRTRTFAILETPKGFNPWDCGPLRNVQEVMGYSLIDWFLPVKYSPCASHSSEDSMFKLNTQVEELKEEAGLLPSRPKSGRGHSSHRKTRRRRDSRRSSRRGETKDLTNHVPTDIMSPPLVIARHDVDEE